MKRFLYLTQMTDFYNRLSYQKAESRKFDRIRILRRQTTFTRAAATWNNVLFLPSHELSKLYCCVVTFHLVASDTFMTSLIAIVEGLKDLPIGECLASLLGLLKLQAVSEEKKGSHKTTSSVIMISSGP